MNYASVCSGVEAASLAWHSLGWEPVWFSEIEPFPAAVLQTRFPNVPNLGDMTKIEGEKYRGTVDLLVGGTPCQGFSVAGKQGGLDDPRSALCLKYIDILKTMQPRWFVWENVPGVFSTNGGSDFTRFISEIENIGYGVAWRVLDAQYVRTYQFPRAVPQRRRRVFVVGYFGDWRPAAEVLFEPTGLLGNPPPRRIKRQVLTGGFEANFNETSESLICVHGSQNPIYNTEHANAVNRNQGIENVICRASDSTNAEYGHGICPTLAARSYKGGAFIAYENHMQDSRVKPCGECSPQINAKAGTGGGNLPLVQTYGIAENIINRQDKNGGNGVGAQSELSYTLNTCGVHGVAIQNVKAICTKGNGDAFESDVHTALTTGGGQAGQGYPACRINAPVRRLTPLECERLMGFPDNWTRIPWRVWQECNRKGISYEAELQRRGLKLKEPAGEDCPDSPRYKACGNSMCVNVMQWIGARIQRVENIIKENEK